MDPRKYTSVAHAALSFANPMSEAAIDRALSLMALPDGARVIDVGCGKGEVAARIARRWRGTVDAVDSSQPMCDEARRRSRGAPVVIHNRDAGAFVRSVPPATYDGAVCLGSSHALGGWAQALDQLRLIVKPGGEALIGEGVWENQPAQEYLAATGITLGEMPTLHGLLAAADQLGFNARWCTTATQREWDEYECAHARAIDDFVAANPADPEAPAMLTRSRAWRDAYRRWGRGTLGFALAILRR